VKLSVRQADEARKRTRTRSELSEVDVKRIAKAVADELDERKEQRRMDEAQVRTRDGRCWYCHIGVAFLDNGMHVYDWDGRRVLVGCVENVERRENRRVERAINQCNGCQRGIDAVERPNISRPGTHYIHRDPSGIAWRDESCTAHLYGHKPHGVE
jgi:hypothetical protein